MASNEAKTYTLAEFQVPPDKADDAAGILVAHGALGCEVRRISRRRARNDDNPALLRAYFVRITPAALKELHHKLQTAGMLTKGAVTERRELVDPGWATMWQARFTPLRIGRRLLIVPPWHCGSASDRITVVIQPGQAFGTGHHPSTAGALSAIEHLCEAKQIAHALDVGTGSGILAIAMIKLGVTDVIATDTDAEALANARENAKLNRVTGRIEFSTAPAGSLKEKFTLVVANILSSTLIRMAPELCARLRYHGHLVLGGILRREADLVARAYTDELNSIARDHHGVWTTLIFRK